MIYRGISFSLQSQFDARAIPEYPPPTVTATPSPRKNKNDTVSSYAPSSPRTAECYVPVYPGSQLWINYDCPSPEDTSSPDMKYYYFKMFMGGRCLLSWGIGAEDAWRGVTTYGIFRGEPNFEGHGILEKRAFFFPKEREVEMEPGSFEIQVFRSKGRRRELPKFENFESPARGGLKWNNAGRMRKTEPRRMFSYALIDAVDQPYATFRYHLRTVSQLERLGFDLENTDVLKNFIASSPGKESRVSCDIASSPPAPAVPKEDSSASRRLSFPPRLHLAPTIRPDHQSPIKKNSGLAQSDSFQGFDTPKEPQKKPPPTVVQAKQRRKESPPQRSFSFSKKPLPTPPEKQERVPTPTLDMSSSTSSRTGSLKGFASRLKRRSDSRDEKGIFGVF